MVNEDYSCIKEVTKIVNLTLPSSYNTNEVSGICDTLESWKRQYVKQLQGIVVGYKNVSLTSKRGYIKADCPATYCSVKATFELFYPTIGSIIKGKINRISQDYIGCLVHDTINVTVHRTADIPDDVLNCIVLDCFILFQITRIIFKSKFIHVKGKITEECVTLMKESGLLSDNVHVRHDTNLICTSPDFPCSSSSSIVNNNLISNSDAQGSSVYFDTPTDTSSQTSPRKKKKKHKKSKDFSVSPSLISELGENNLNLVNSTHSSDNNSRKRKRQKSDANLSATALEDEMESPRPKKKVKTEERITNYDMNEVELNEFSADTRKRKRKKSHIDLVAALDDETELTHPSKRIKTEELVSPVNDSMEYFDNNLSSMSSDASNLENPNSVNAKISSRSIASEIKNSSVKSELSSPVKKKKHKKSKNNLDPSSSFSDHKLNSEINKMEPAGAPILNTSPTQVKSEGDLLTSPPLFDDALNETTGEAELLKPKKKKKKRNTSDKKKTLKKKKDKLKKGSKKDKKKKSKVISTKKKLTGHKLKKKKKNKDEKSKKPKKSKNKKSQDVPK